MRAGMLGASQAGLGTGRPGQAPSCFASRGGGEKCQLILDCKHIRVPTPDQVFVVNYSLHPLPCPTLPGTLTIIKATKERCKAPGIPAWARERPGTAGEGSSGLGLDPSSDVALRRWALGKGTPPCPCLSPHL